MSDDAVLFFRMQAPLWTALPGFAAQALKKFNKLLVSLPDAEQCARLDALLWTFSAETFVPHGTLDAPFAQRQPMLLTHGPASLPAINDATVLLAVSPPSPETLPTQGTLILPFSRQDDPQPMRALWLQMKAAGRNVTHRDL